MEMLRSSHAELERRQRDVQLGDDFSSKYQAGGRKKVLSGGV